jgi:hypothetical protein
MHVNPSPRNMELFYLRLILLNTSGATSFEDLLTVDGTCHGTFREACLAMGLAGKEDDAYGRAMNEVVLHGTAWQLRMFFSTLIVHCHISNVSDMWIEHRKSMSEDFLRRGTSFEAAIGRCRRQILEMVESMEFEEMDSLRRILTLPSRSDVDDICADAMVRNELTSPQRCVSCKCNVPF